MEHSLFQVLLTVALCGDTGRRTTNFLTLVTSVCVHVRERDSLQVHPGTYGTSGDSPTVANLYSENVVHFELINRHRNNSLVVFKEPL